MASHANSRVPLARRALRGSASVRRATGAGGGDATRRRLAAARLTAEGRRHGEGSGGPPPGFPVWSARWRLWAGVGWAARPQVKLVGIAGGDMLSNNADSTGLRSMEGCILESPTARRQFVRAALVTGFALCFVAVVLGRAPAAVAAGGAGQWKVAGMPGMQAYVSFANPHQGWVLGSDFMPSQSSPEATAESLMVTSDGVHWQRKSIPGVASDFLGPIVLLDRLHGWIAVNELSGGYAILRTSDGGNTWQRVERNPLPMGDQVLALAFADRSHGWAVGGNEGGGGGIIFATTDGGVSWQRQLVTPAPLCCAYFASDSRGWAGGYGGALLTTSDGGRIWRRQVSGTTMTLADITFADPQHGWIAANDLVVTLRQHMTGVLLATADGGATWQPLKTPRGMGPASVNFANDNDGWLGGCENFADNAAVLAVTSDGGRIWQVRRSPIKGDVDAIDLLGPGYGWATVFGNTGSALLELGSPPVSQVAIGTPATSRSHLVLWVVILGVVAVGVVIGVVAARGRATRAV